MSLQSENIVPGKHGKVFNINIEEEKDFERVKEVLIERVEGIRDVFFNKEVHPHELTIHTDTLVHVEDVQKVIQEQGFHAVPKTLFGLEE